MSPSKRNRRLSVTAAVVAGYVVATILATRRGYRFGRNTPVRCRQGHLFSTTWIPGGSLKALRLGPWRVQWCPIGRHVDLVHPVKDADLTEAEREFATSHHDVLVP
jgi:hypothetical protein